VTLFRLLPIAPGGVDHALAVAPTVTLTRQGGVLYADVVEGDAAGLIRALAFAGVAATVCAADPVGPRAVPAIGRDLAPLPAGLVDVDSVRVRRLALGEATREILRRRWAALRGPSSAARERCRAVLRGEDAVFAWERRAWGPRERLRDPRTRASLRPIVFDREALVRASEGRTYASEGAIGRWLLA